MRISRILGWTSFVFAVAAFNALPTAAQELTWGGQVRPRFEFRDPASDGSSEAFTSMRTRLTLSVRADQGLTVFVQAQDVRLWGSQSHPLLDFSTDGFDMHQAYLRLNPSALSWLTATVGRAEVNLGGQRLVGAVDWAPQAQSFDGVRLDADAGRSSWTLLAKQVNDAADADVTQDRALFGAQGTLASLGPGALEAYWLLDHIRSESETDEHLVGARYAFAGRLTGRAEATLARGSRADRDVSAYMFGLRLGSSFANDRLTAVLWYDYLSGDDPSTPEQEVFNTFFGTNHKFYGLADLFLNIPRDTGGAGLQDMALKLGWAWSEQTSASMALHGFRAARGTDLATPRYGEEVDLVLAHRYSEHLGTSIGFSRVFQADGLAEIGRLDQDMTWAFIMLNATF